MDVKKAIEKRRAYRALDPVEITDEIVDSLSGAARLTASCFNKQPWKFVFVKSKEQLEKMHRALNKGNEWAKKASMIIAVFSKKDDDCVIKEREYNLFDTGMAVSAMILRATELGLVAHPIAGYSPEKTAEILGIPQEYIVITLVIVGKKSADTSGLNDTQKSSEERRPERKDIKEFIFMDKYS